MARRLPSGAVVGLVVAALVVAVLAFAPGAGAYIYWTDVYGHIGRANLDGSGVDRNFIAGAGRACGIAVGARHIYWGTTLPNTAGGQIGRANVDGSRPQPDFIGFDLPNPFVYPSPCGLAVAAEHVYWTSRSRSSIGRATLDGSGVDPDFLPGATADGLAVDAAHIYWWGPGGPPYVGAPSLARANLDGTGIDRGLVVGFDPYGDPATGPIAVDGEHIYWKNSVCAEGPCHHAIGRASLNGSDRDGNFIDLGFDHQAMGLAVGSGHLYWIAGAAGTDGGTVVRGIGRANLDGTNVDQDFIAAGWIRGLAVDAAEPPQGTAGDDRLTGTAGDEVLCGLAGSDAIFGRGGDDTVFGDACDATASPPMPSAAKRDGNDSLFGGRGNDALYGGGGADLIAGGAGRDQLRGGPGNDQLRARDGRRDKINCGPGRDRVRADNRDQLRGCELIHRQ
jgi:virginiamycin B lyase